MILNSAAILEVLNLALMQVAGQFVSWFWGSFVYLLTGQSAEPTGTPETPKKKRSPKKKSEEATGSGEVPAAEPKAKRVRKTKQPVEGDAHSNVEEKGKVSRKPKTVKPLPEKGAE